MWVFLQPETLARRLLFWGAVAVALATPPAEATVFVGVDDGTLADRASLIVTGRILAREAALGPAIGYRLEIETVVKGTPPADLVVWFPGGGHGGLVMQLAGVPRFDPGESALLFLRSLQDGRWVPSHLALGAFKIREGERGRVAFRDNVAPSPRKAARDLDRFLAWLADRERPVDYLVAADKELAGDRPAGADKFGRVVSSTDPPPFGCGANGGHAVRWFDFDPQGGVSSGEPVGWRLHFSGQSGLADGGLAPFRAGLAAWTEDPHSTVELDFRGLTAATGGLAVRDGVNGVLFGDPADLIPGSVEDTGILALGGPWFRCDLVEHGGELFHPIVEADIITNQGLERFLAATSDPRDTLEEILGHELGHTLGFAHTEDREALMYATVHADGRGAALGVDDLAALLETYGGGELDPPAAPSNLIAAATFPTSAQIAWSDNSSDESNFRLERRAGGDFVPIATVAADRRSYRDAGLAPETDYRYRVRAQNGAGASDYSLEATLTTPPDLRPAAPSNLRAAPLSSTEIRLTWQDNSDDELTFALFILDSRTSNFLEIPFAVPAETTTVLLTQLAPFTRYTLKVAARNDFGTSPLSNAAGAATFPADGACSVDADRLCLLSGRFRAELRFVDPATGLETRATAVPSTDQTGLFWFFDPGNVELIVKMLDGAAINDHFWVFYGGVSDLEYRLEITDTVGGTTKVYENASGEVCGRADTAAFEAGDATAIGAGGPPRKRPAPGPAETSDAALLAVSLPASGPGRPSPKVSPAGSCEPAPDRLCLLDGRLQLEVRWRNPSNGEEGDGQAVYGGDNSGMFWFFDPQNLELVVKTLDGTAVNGHLWLFYGALTDLEYELTATDTVTGTRRVYHNPAGRICGRADTEAFATAGEPALRDASRR